MSREVFDHSFARFTRLSMQCFDTTEAARCSGVRIDVVHCIVVLYGSHLMDCLRPCRGNMRRFNISDRSLGADFKLVPVNSCGDFGVSGDASRGGSMTGCSGSGCGGDGGDAGTTVGGVGGTSVTCAGIS